VKLTLDQRFAVPILTSAGDSHCDMGCFPNDEIDL
jgi:hypothetical protein